MYLNEEESSVVGLLLCLLGSAEVSLGGEELREEIIKEIWRDGWSVGVLPTPPVPLSVALWHCYCCSANVGKRDKLDLCPRSWYRFEITPNGFWSKTALGMPESGHKMTRRRQQQPEMLRFSRLEKVQSSVCPSHSFRISPLLPWQCSGRDDCQCQKSSTANGTSTPGARVWRGRGRKTQGGRRKRGERDAVEPVEVTKIDDDGRQIRRATMRLNFSLSNRENEQAGRVSEKIVHANSHQRHDNDNEMQTVGGAELREKYSGVFSGEP